MFAPTILLLGIAAICVVFVETSWRDWHLAPFLTFAFFGSIAPLFLLAFMQITLKSYRYALLGEGSDRWWVRPSLKRLLKWGGYSLLYTGMLRVFFGGAAFMIGDFGFYLSTVFMAIFLGLFGLFLGIGLMKACLYAGTAMIAVGSFVFNFDLMANISFRLLAELRCLLETPQEICGILVILAAFYPGIRLSFYALFIAIDTPKPFRSSWALLKGNIWRFVGFYALLFLVVGALIAALYIGLGLAFAKSETGSTIVFFLNTLVFMPVLSGIIFSQGFALVYQTLKKEEPLK